MNVVVKGEDWTGEVEGGVESIGDIVGEGVGGERVRSGDAVAFREVVGIGSLLLYREERIIRWRFREDVRSA